MESGDPFLTPVTVTTTAEEVYRRLKHAITDGDLSPGTRLVEAALAKQLGVSRTPVREALQRLSQDGLAASDGSRGLIVARLSIENIAHAYVLRETLEGLAARLAASHQRPDLLEDLSQSLRHMEHDAVDAAAFDAAHSRFHDTIAEMSGNPYLIQALKNLEGFRTRMVTLDWVARNRVRISVPEHRLIFEAIEMRDSELAEHYARLHVSKTREGLMKRLGSPALDD
ncbi:GntR family transcriptional regulator [Sulfobacillus harzensis]|uniref:GntR family transcriptional regulator n=1 Tax=Sulfobacillus harzensis TaxID=2729629 RepID=A0A7Y0L4C8_9FIRM|nr:GntR family transcriptional regulator [Sulfobacillus harzensis]NMP22717.1 GntR family transcriptional regulator [Sulfobacillus harzensis]